MKLFTLSVETSGITVLLLVITYYYFPGLRGCVTIGNGLYELNISVDNFDEACSEKWYTVEMLILCNILQNIYEVSMALI